MNKVDVIEQVLKHCNDNTVVHKVVHLVVCKYVERRDWNTRRILDEHFEELMSLLLEYLVLENKSLFDMAVQATALNVRPILVHLPINDQEDTQKAVREFLGQHRPLVPVSPKDAIIKETT